MTQTSRKQINKRIGGMGGVYSLFYERFSQSQAICGVLKANLHGTKEIQNHCSILVTSPSSSATSLT
jgi:hypothetical protein